MQDLQRAMVKVLILVPLAVFAILFAIGPGGIVSYTPETRVGVHSLLAFWISIPAALVLLAYQKEQRRSSIFMISAFVYSLVVHIGSAAKYMFALSEPFVERLLSDTVIDLLEFSLVGILLMGAMIYIRIQPTPTRPQLSKNGILLLIFLIVPLVLHAIVWMSIPYLTESLIISISYAMGIIAITSFLISSILVLQAKKSSLPIDSGYLASATLLLCVASIASILNMQNPSISWEFAETLQMAAYLLICLSLSVSYFKKSGYRRRVAYSLTIGLILMAYLPFLLTIIFESLALIIILQPMNFLAYSIIHIGAASLSATMAVLLYIYPKKETAWVHVPLVLIFSLWAVVSFLLVFVFAFPMVTLRGEPTTPVVVGSAITLALLVLSIRWTLNPRTGRQTPSLLNYAAFTAFFTILVVAAETVNQITLNAYPELEESLYGASLILGTNLVIMFAFTYLIFLLADNSRGVPPVEMYVVFFLGMWILPNILKSYYTTWTTGWWVSEILLFIGLLAGPPLLIWLYLRAMRDVQSSHNRASLYADLLMHDVSNYNQMVMTTLELLGSKEISDDKRQRLSDDGCQVITFSEQLIANVRLLSETDNLEHTKLEPTNLVSTIVSALDMFTKRVGSGELMVEFRPEQSEALVMANELLVHIFLNIFYSALECHLRGEAVTIGLESVRVSGEDYWQINIKAPGRSHDVEQEYSSGTLGLTAAKFMTQSLNGHFEVDRYEQLDQCEGRLFTIRLHSISV
ncbi:MAG: hypothetical protein ACFFDM_09805 [Candidatus Thorarchaeota archaeon]